MRYRSPRRCRGEQGAASVTTAAIEEEGGVTSIVAAAVEAAAGGGEATTTVTASKGSKQVRLNPFVWHPMKTSIRIPVEVLVGTGVGVDN